MSIETNQYYESNADTAQYEDMMKENKTKEKMTKQERRLFAYVVLIFIAIFAVFVVINLFASLFVSAGFIIVGVIVALAAWALGGGLALHSSSVSPQNTTHKLMCLVSVEYMKANMEARYHNPWSNFDYIILSIIVSLMMIIAGFIGWIF